MGIYKQCSVFELFDSVQKTPYQGQKRPKNGQKRPKMAKKNFGPKILVFCYRDLALAVPVVLAPSEAFFDFSFPSYSRFREGTPPMRQNVSRGEGRLFVTSEGFPHENGHNSETKSRKMLPNVAKRPKRRGLGPYSKKTKFFGKIFFGPFLAFFGHFLVIFCRWG